MSKIDVVIATRGEWYLPYCINRVRKVVPLNNLIIVAPSEVKEKIKNFSDIFVAYNGKNIGRIRAKGLEYVETEFFSFIDSDVILNPHWFSWCIKTISKRDVGACQGCIKPIAKIYGKVYEQYAKRAVKMGKGFCDLGNTMLKTELVRKLGMPQLSVGEDQALKRKIEKAGYKWVCNADLVSIELKTDADALRHAIFWARKDSNFDVKHHVREIAYHCSKGLLKFKLNENFFMIGLHLLAIYGKISGFLNR